MLFSITHLFIYFIIFSDNANIDDLFTKYKLRKLTLLRSFCQKNGVQLVLREYTFDNKHSNKDIFHEDDILNLFPIVKHVPSKVVESLYSSIIIKTISAYSLSLFIYIGH